MKLPWSVFVLLLAMCGAVGSVLMTEEPTLSTATESQDERASDSANEPEAKEAVAGHGIPHPTIGSMQVGGDSELRYAPIRIAVWVFAVAMVVFFLALLMLASQKGESRTLRMKWPLIIGGTFYLATVIGMLVSYERFMTDPNPKLWWGFPAPSAWMLFAVWPTPVLFVILYVVTFDRWTFRTEDQQEFERILQRRAVVENPSEVAS